MYVTTVADTHPAMITIAQIAREAGVSTASVSYVLNGRPNRLTPATRDRILQIARRYDYQPNALVRAIQKKRTHTIAVLLNLLNSSISFFGEIVVAIQTESRERGYQVLLGQTGPLQDDTEKQVRIYREMRVDGLMMAPNPAAASYYAGLKKAGLPLVFVDGRIPDIGIPYVHSDDVLGAKLAVRHLIGLGHRRIATFAAMESDRVSPIRDRFQGYQEALSEAGRPFDTTLVESVGTAADTEVRHAVLTLLARTSFTALFVATDTQAIIAMETLKDAGKRVPEDVAVIGYANMREGAHVSPRLTSVDQKTEEIGRRAATVLFDLIEYPARKPPLDIMTTPELVIRESCGARQTGDRWQG